MKILVTGGTGFLGSHIIDRLLERHDAEIYALVRNPDRVRWLGGVRNVSLLKGDLFHIPPLPAGLSVVFHSAGLTKSPKSSDYYTVNRDGTASLMGVLEAGGMTPRVVHLSSLAAAGPSSPGRPSREEDPPRPLSPYGKSKLEAEEEVLRFSPRFPVILLRVGGIYGPRDEDFLVYFRWVKRGLIPLLGPGEKLLSICYVGDVVEACLKAALLPAVPSGAVINIAHGKPVSWKEFGETAARLLGRRARALRIPRWAAFLAAAGAGGFSKVSGQASPLNLGKFREMKAPGWVADVRKAREILGFEARHGLEDGLKKTLDWYAANGHL